MEQVLFRDDPLSRLDDAGTYQEKLAVAHEALKKKCAGIDRISVVLYDNQTRSLKTFVACPASESPLKNYETELAADSALNEIARKSSPRIVNDLRIYANRESVHARAIVGQGYASSYTHPMYHNRELAGFVFFNSYHNRYFRERVLEHVEIFSHLLAAMVVNDLAVARSLLAAMRTSVCMVQKHDLETGTHLERMSRYSRLIARSLAITGLQQLDDEQVEQIALFAPLHDVGKIGVPERVLRKPARLTRQERELIKTHPLLGRQIVDDLISNFGFERIPYIDYLRDITEMHHEAMDGSGYPHGLCGKEISLAARIVAVSDIFDALTTRRPYKTSWTNEHAFAMLQLLAIDKLDEQCVRALIACPGEIARIQQQFAETH